MPSYQSRRQIALVHALAANYVSEDSDYGATQTNTTGLRVPPARGLRTIDGYEATHRIRKGQIRWLLKGDVVGQRWFIHTLFGIAA